jgi:hypothetical protein
LVSVNNKSLVSVNYIPKSWCLWKKSPRA